MAPFSCVRRAILWYHLMAPFYGMCVPGLMFCSVRSGTAEPSRNCVVYSECLTYVLLLCISIALCEPDADEIILVSANFKARHIPL